MHYDVFQHCQPDTLAYAMQRQVVCYHYNKSSLTSRIGFSILQRLLYLLIPPMFGMFLPCFSLSNSKASECFEIFTLYTNSSPISTYFISHSMSTLRPGCDLILKKLQKGGLPACGLWLTQSSSISANCKNLAILCTETEACQYIYTCTQ